MTPFFQEVFQRHRQAFVHDAEVVAERTDVGEPVEVPVELT